MRRVTVIALGALVLAALVLCPISQMFDRWDHAETKGKDTESSLMLVAECAGAAIAIIHAASAVTPHFLAAEPASILLSSTVAPQPVDRENCRAPESPPPLPLRI